MLKLVSVKILNNKLTTIAISTNSTMNTTVCASTCPTTTMATDVALLYVLYAHFILDMYCIFAFIVYKYLVVFGDKRIFTLCDRIINIFEKTSNVYNNHTQVSHNDSEPESEPDSGSTHDEKMSTVSKNESCGEDAVQEDETDIEMETECIDSEVKAP